MKTTAILFITIAIIAINASAQVVTTNCWYSTDYQLLGERFGDKKVKGTKATVCFNENAMSFYTKETGLITFNFTRTGIGVDSSFHNQFYWEGISLPNQYSPIGDWTFKMTYNHKIWINNGVEGYAVLFNNVAHQVNGPVKFSGKADKRINKLSPKIAIDMYKPLDFFSNVRRVGKFDRTNTKFIPIRVGDFEDDSLLVYFMDKQQNKHDTLVVSRYYPYAPIEWLYKYPSYIYVVGKKRDNFYEVSNEKK